MSNTSSVTTIPGNLIQAGTINAAKINIASISTIKLPEPRDFNNEVVTYWEFSAYGNRCKDCVIVNVPRYASISAMIDKVDENGNYYQA